MMPEQQQRILGYFIEEAKDHLNTIEQGLLNLQNTIQDPEMVTEVFRAAHSVKGGAAMLSLGSIQATSHRLEDYFKLLKEAPNTQVDRDLETMFLQVFDVLQALLEELQGPFGLTEEKAQEVMADIEPVFDRLGSHLNELIAVAPAAAAPAAVAPVPAQPTRTVASSSEDSALKLVFSSDVPGHLREMLTLFKQADTAASRAALQACCDALKRVGEQFDLSLWCDLTTATRHAVGNSDQTYRSLAPVIIKELKRAQEQVLAGQANAIVVSAELESLMPLLVEPEDVVGDIDSLLDDALSTTEEPDLADLFATETESATGAEADLDWLDLSEDAADTAASDHDDDLADSLSAFTNDESPTELPREPTVGTAELNSLADLFEGEVSELDSPWEEISESEAAVADTPSPDIELDSDFSDLLDDSLGDDDDADSSGDLADLFGDTGGFGDATPAVANSSDTDDDLDDLLNLGAETSDADTFAAEGEDDLDSLLDGVDTSSDNGHNDLGDDLDLDFDESSDALDLDFAASSEDAATDADFDDLFDTEEPAAATAADRSEESFQLDSVDHAAEPESAVTDASTSGTTVASAEGDDFGAISDPWSAGGDDASEDVELALDAFDEWSDESTAAATDGSELDFSDFPDIDETAAATPDDDGAATDDFDDLFGEAAASESTPSTASEFDDAELELDAIAAPEVSAASEAGSAARLDEPAPADTTAAAADADLSDLFATAVPANGTDLDFLDETTSATEAADAIDDVDLLFGADTDSRIDSADPDFDDLLGDTVQAADTEPTVAAPDTDESVDDFDLTFADDSDETLAVDSDAAAIGLEGDLSATTVPDDSDDLFAAGTAAADDSDDWFGTDDAELTGTTTVTSSDDADDFFGSDDVSLSDADEAAATNSNDIDDFFSTDDSATETDHDLDASASDADDTSDVSLDFDAESGLDDLELATAPEADGQDAAATDDTDFDVLDLGDVDLGDDNADLADSELHDLGSESASEDLFGGPEDSAVDADRGDLDLDLGTFDDVTDESDSLDDLSLDGDDGGEFDDLDAMLAEDTTGIAPESFAVDEPVAAATDEFGELDALLDDDAAVTAANAAVSEIDVDFDELDALIGDSDTPATAATAPASRDPADDDFGDLEKLLEEADQTLGGGSTSLRSPGPGRSNRRVGGIVDQTMRVSVKHLDNLNNLVGELVVNRNSLEQDQDRFRQFLDNLLFQVQQLNDVGQRMRDLYERSLLESSLLASRQAFHSGGSALSTMTNGNHGDSHATGASFDALEMDRFTGFHTLTQEMIELIVRVRESSSDIAYTVESTDQIARQFRQVTTQLQEGLNKARMVPFAQTADRLPRAVRDISIKCGKEARLVVEGRETLIDKMLLERLYDPMTHLVNNAITHGIEPPEERAALGKPREGKIAVRAFYQGNQTVIYIEDDGAGINPTVIKQKAIQKGLITQAEADRMNDVEARELIFHHGFSVLDRANDFAGRGVGMDVVRTALAEIRGSITIDSEVGKGTSFTIRLPLTLSISKALSCLNNQARIAFPMDGVEDMFDVPRERVQTNDEGQSFIQWRDMSLTFQPLSDLLQFNRALGRGRVYGGSQDDDMVSIVVLRNANTYIGIQVDRVLGEQEIVIKQIEGPVPKPMGIAGATVLGDGRVMPIGDVLELIDIAQGRVRREAGSSIWAQVELSPEEDEGPVKAEPTVLIVDDSITVRELLSMSFNKVGYRVEQARDGQEAWEKMRSGLPCDLVFCDIEMPRMDGLELLSRMQKDSMLKNIPIAMLTSRGADRHRQMAVDLGASGYFTKPYLEEALLEAAHKMLQGEVLIGAAVTEEAE
ncbi:response regulator [Halomicronema sp. CCY15110]|uniref:response regulator n=1 Tax=Halomicronema sp. CCY15110 TaxID=2767773 RepID=UPI0019508289|nr:response regulator [Halomicronema sp. CCY15110]